MIKDNFNIVKIYILGPAYPFRGGISDSGMRLARELQREGHEVQLINFRVQYPPILFPGKTQYSNSQPPRDLRIRRLVHSYNPLNWLKVGWCLKKEKPDLVIVRFWLPFMAMALGTICRLIKLNGKSKIISIADNVIPHEKRLGDRLLTRYFIGSVDKLVVMSQGVEDQAKTFTDKPIRVLAHPIYDIFGEPYDKDKAKIMLGLQPEDKTILFFGLIRDYKGLDILLEAMTDTRLQERKIQLIIAGEYYSNEKLYDKYIEDNKLEERIVRATHFIPTDQVSLYFSAADVVVQPYKTATQSGITQIAIYFEKPMIVTRVGGLPEVVHDGENGLICEVTAQSVADNIVKYFDRQLEDTFMAHIRNEKKKYAWSFFTQKIIEFAERA